MNTQTDFFELKLTVDTVPASSRVPARNELPVETRAAILFWRFGPYHHARLNAAGQWMSVWGVEACGMEDTYAWSKVEGAAAFSRITLTDHDLGSRTWKQELQRKMRQTLDEIKPQVVVIPGWSFADALSGLLWCAETNTPAVIMSESTAWDEPRKFWKEWIKGRLVKMCAAGLAGGTPHADYLAQLGLSRDRISVGYDVVDNDHFAKQAAEVRTREPELRKQHGLPEKYFLASARFIGKKNLARLLEAYARYRALAEQSAVIPWNLVLLGDGPLREAINAKIMALNLSEQVKLPGFKQYDELPAYFALAGAFVHASTTEQWGLVVNEAMASGLPVLVSNRCGCAQDLVREGVNGFTFDPGNTEEMTGRMWQLSSLGPLQLSTMGAASRQIVASWGPERFASGLRAAAALALKNPRPRAGILDRVLLRLLLLR